MRDQLLGGRYRLVRQLGEGGMGQVWEAQDETLGRKVAVKVISLLAGGGSRGDEARARFLREARITAQLQHPNIVTIHDLGETGAGNELVPFLVMELVRGEGLDVMLRRGVVTLADAARWGAQICDALADAHDAGIMHRDIKPSNILITPSGTVKVLDFGIARAADPYATADRLTQTGFIVGTPPYMAPEQARGFPEPRSDLYALGCLLFELITGRLPFQAPDTVGFLTAHLTQEPPTPSSVFPDVPPAWDDLVLTLLRKEPDKRYPNAAALAQALRQLDRAHAIGPSRVSPQTESRAAILARLATAMQAAHDVAEQSTVLLDGQPPATPPTVPETTTAFRMPVDDVFSITGRGTVVVGRIECGVIRVNEEVELVGTKEKPIKATVTGVEMSRKRVDAGQAGDRVGLLLRGIKLAGVEGGMVVVKPSTTPPKSVATQPANAQQSPVPANARPTRPTRPATEAADAIIKRAGEPKRSNYHVLMESSGCIIGGLVFIVIFVGVIALIEILLGNGSR